jgi:DNA polymerase II small subunit/DNA polymerase delta subunit B
MDEEVEEKVRHGGLDQRTARKLASIPDKETQRKVAYIAIKKDMTVKQAEDLVSTIKKAPESLSKAIIEEKEKDGNWHSWYQCRSCGRRVEI